MTTRSRPEEVLSTLAALAFAAFLADLVSGGEVMRRIGAAVRSRRPGGAPVPAGPDSRDIENVITEAKRITREEVE